MINVLIADDHALLADSLSMVLQGDDIHVVAIAYDGEEAVKKCSELYPDVALIDIKMPLLNGMEAARLIKENCPETRVAVLTSFEDGKKVLNCLIKGVDGYILKDTPPEKLKVLIKCIYWGFCVLSGSAKQLLQYELLGENGTIVSLEASKSMKLEDIEIIRYISEGKSNYEIGKILGYAEGTVKNKITKLLESAGVDSRAQLVMAALKNNLI